MAAMLGVCAALAPVGAVRAQHPDDPFTALVGLERVLSVGPYTGDPEAGVVFAVPFYARTTNGDERRPFFPHAITRVAVDVHVVEGLTLGGVAGLGLSVGNPPSTESSYVPEDQIEDLPDPTALTYVTGGRVGYQDRSPNGENAAWVRLGVVHARGSEEARDGWAPALRRDALTSVQLEAALVAPVTRWLAITLAASLELALDGTREEQRGGATLESRWVVDALVVSAGTVAFF